MTDRSNRRWFRFAIWPSAIIGVTLTIESAAPLALPLLPIDRTTATPMILIEDGAQPATGAADAETGSQSPLAELTAALTAARAKLEQLERATAALAGVAALRAELNAKDEENRSLLAELDALRQQSAEWQRADEAARVQISGLSQALDESAADIKKLEGELATLRWQNAELGASLGRARSEQETLSAELGEQVNELTASVEASTAEAARLKQELADRSADLAAAEDAQRRGATRIAQLEDALAGAQSDLRGLEEQASADADRLGEANAALALREQERDAAVSALEGERTRAGRLREALAVAEADLEQAQAANRDLEMRTASLDEAVLAATDAARQNLQAVESQIAALNSTLAEVELAPLAGEGAREPEANGAAGSASAGAPAPEQPDGSEMIPAAANRQDAEVAEVAPGAGPVATPANGEAALVRRSEPDADEAIGPLAMLTHDLPVEGRIQAQSLLADLNAQTDPQGLRLTVPGEEIFTVNSEQIRSSAHDSLAKVAELINLYEDRPVVIVGHTDAVGAAEYNDTLSLRRASLVKGFFVEHFDVEEDRLTPQGMGEQQPIASNATAAGRRANRRVEVVILK